MSGKSSVLSKSIPALSNSKKEKRRDHVTATLFV
jgi:hypothetical protein